MRLRGKVPRYFAEAIRNFAEHAVLFQLSGTCEEELMKYALIIATAATIATPAFAEEVGIRVGPAGVTVGESHRDHYRDRDRDRDRDGVTVIKQRREPGERTTVIKKSYDDGVETKTIIRRDRD
jgi:hypothetical protein